MSWVRDIAEMVHEAARSLKAAASVFLNAKPVYKLKITETLQNDDGVRTTEIEGRNLSAEDIHAFRISFETHPQIVDLEADFVSVEFQFSDDVALNLDALEPREVLPDALDIPSADMFQIDESDLY